MVVAAIGKAYDIERQASEEKLTLSVRGAMQAKESWRCWPR